MSVAGHDMVILNNHKVNADLLEKRANIYSSRPRLVGMSHICTIFIKIFSHLLLSGIGNPNRGYAYPICIPR